MHVHGVHLRGLDVTPGVESLRRGRPAPSSKRCLALCTWRISPGAPEVEEIGRRGREAFLAGWLLQEWREGTQPVMVGGAEASP